MRIGTKLLLTYLILIGLVAVAAGLGLPRWVRATVIETEQARLEKQAQLLADRVGGRVRSRLAEDLRSARATLSFVEDLLVEETVAIVEPGGLVIMATRPELRGKSIQAPCMVSGPQRRRSFASPLVEIKGIGPVILACAPLGTRSPALQDFTLLMVRDMSFVESLAIPIARRVSMLVIFGLIASLIVAGWLSRDFVRRLREMGQAARALADGDLASRAPEHGNDEITDLAGHFNHMAERIQALVSGLRRSEQARKELLVLVSHELRTPMTSIAGFAEALRDGVVQGDERRNRYYQIIAAEAARLTRLINNLFDMAKLEAGQVDLNLQAMSVTSWLVEFAEGFRPVAEAAGASIELEISPEAERARIYGDRDRLDQVLSNLAGNGVRFTPPGDPVRLRARVEGEELVVEVADRGPGLSPDESDRVFDRFFQGTNKGRDHKGAGLGLSIVKSLVEAHGGTVGVESSPGAGATFWFRLHQLN